MKKLLMLLVSVFLIGCAGNIESGRYETSATGKVNSATEGVIINVRAVKVATTDGSVGKIAGGIAGGAAGSMIGGNSVVSLIGAVGGAVAGGYLGDKAQEGLSKQDGFEYVVKLDSGRAITLTQGTDEKFSVGQKVYVLDADRGARARIIAR